MSLVLLEAMNFGCPVLTSDIPENKEIVKEYGWYFNVGSTFDLKNQLGHLLALPHNTLLKKAKQAQIYVQNNFEWEKIVDATLRVYNKLVPEDHSIIATSVIPSSSKSTAAIERGF
jgi:glycosyltransferase involved in cell wall biosynthesis